MSTKESFSFQEKVSESVTQLRLKRPQLSLRKCFYAILGALFCLLVVVLCIQIPYIFLQMKSDKEIYEQTQLIEQNLSF